MRQVGGTIFHFLWVLAVVILLGGLTVCVLAGDGEDDHKGVPGVMVLISHDGGDDYGSDGNSGGEYDGGESGDTDQRGDHNCRNFCFYGVPMPGGEQPESLFPPTPEGIRAFVLSTIQAGIEMGRLFSDTVITFVSNLLVGIA